MAEPATRETLKQYALRALGKPVIEINVDDDQLEDRIDEAVQFFQQYHYDGIKRTYLKYKLTAADKTRLATINGSNETATDGVTGETTTWYEDKNYLVMPSSIMSVINYDIVLRHLDFLDHILVGEKPLRFNQHENRLYIDMDWTNDLQTDEWLVIEAYRKLDPATYTDIWSDMYLKRYTTQLFKKQWGANLSKFNGVAMVGGVTLNGQQIYSEAIQDIEKLENEIRSSYELNPTFMIG